MSPEELEEQTITSCVDMMFYMWSVFCKTGCFEDVWHMNQYKEQDFLIGCRKYVKEHCHDLKEIMSKNINQV